MPVETRTGLGLWTGGELALRTTSLEAARIHLGQILIPHRLERARPEHAVDFRHRRVDFGGISAHQIRYAAPIRLDVVEPPDFYLLQLTLSGCAAGLLDGETVVARVGEFMVVNPGRPFVKWWEPDTEQLMIRIDRRLMERAVDAEWGAARAPHFAPRPLAAVAAPALIGLLGAACADLDGPALLAQPVVGRRMADALLQIMLHTLPHDRRALLEGTVSPAAPRCVRRAEEHIARHAHEDLSLADIARAAGVPARTLHSGFRRFRETSPIEHLRAVRLDRARRRLQDPGETGSVTAVAEECGLRHLGRFAQDYMRRFGERPSETLRRARGAGARGGD